MDKHDSTVGITAKILLLRLEYLFRVFASGKYKLTAHVSFKLGGVGSITVHKNSGAPIYTGVAII